MGGYLMGSSRPGQAGTKFETRSTKFETNSNVQKGLRPFQHVDHGEHPAAFAGGHLKPVIDKVFPFSELPQAKAHMESNAHLGKIILAA